MSQTAMPDPSEQLRAVMRAPVGRPLASQGVLYTPVFRVAFPHLDEPWAGNDPKQPNPNPAFSVIAVFADEADLSEMIGVCNQRLVSKFGDNALSLIQHGVYRYPLRPKMVMARFSGFEGDGYFASFRAQEQSPPQVVAYIDGKATVLQRGAIERHVYAGCYCYATVSPFAYKNVGQGVSLGLRTLVKVAEGERFGGPKAVTAADALEAITNVSLPPGFLPGHPGGPLLEGRAEAPAAPTSGQQAQAAAPATALPAMPGGAQSQAARHAPRQPSGEELLADILG